MKNKCTSIIYFLAGFVNIITSVIWSFSGKTLWAVVYICLALAFFSLGFAYRKKQ